MEHTPLTPEEYQHWKDTALLDGDTIDRFAATIEHLFATKAQLLEALKSSAERLHDLRGDRDCLRHAFRECPKYYCKDARDAIEEARK